jgi:phage-related protein
MSGWILCQFDTIVDSFLSSCNLKLRAKVIERLDLLADKGNSLRRPFTDKLRDGIFELRTGQGRLEPRLLFFFEPLKRIIFVHAFYKKTRWIPEEDIELAIERKKIIKSGKATSNAIDYIN